MSENYLIHHGVKGQKWGIENGPPYPLNAEGKRALKAQKKKLSKDLKEAENNRVNALAKYIHHDTKYKVTKNNEDKKNASSAKKELNKYEKLTNKLLKEIEDKGYKLKTKEVIRLSDIGKKALNNIELEDLMGRKMIYFNSVQKVGAYGDMVSNAAGSNYKTKYKDKTYDQNEAYIVGKKYKLR